MFFEIGLVPDPVAGGPPFRDGELSASPPWPRLSVPARLRSCLHPGPLVAIGTLHANVGITLALGLAWLSRASSSPVRCSPGGVGGCRSVPSGTALAVAGGVPAEADVATGRRLPPSPAASIGCRLRYSGDPARTCTPASWTLTTVPCPSCSCSALPPISGSRGTGLLPVLTFTATPVTSAHRGPLRDGHLRRLSVSRCPSWRQVTRELPAHCQLVMIVSRRRIPAQVPRTVASVTPSLSSPWRRSVGARHGWLVAVLIRHWPPARRPSATVTAAGIVSELAVGSARSIWP